MFKFFVTMEFAGFVDSHFIEVTVVRRVGPPEHPSAIRLLPLQPRVSYKSISSIFSYH